MLAANLLERSDADFLASPLSASAITTAIGPDVKPIQDGDAATSFVYELPASSTPMWIDVPIAISVIGFKDGVGER